MTIKWTTGAALCAAFLAACSSGGDGGTPPTGGGGVTPPAPDPANTKPAFVGTVTKTSYDGTTNDLLTGGLGKTGLQALMPPNFANDQAPTAAELRIRAIYNNYRALLDPTPNGGFGTLYGPNVDSNGVVGTGEGKIAGDESIAYADDGTGRLNVTMMVQVPNTFNVNAPCIVTATSSGSRGVYGAIGTSGEWGLKKGCAVAYTDKGTGNGAHELVLHRVTKQDGTLVPAATAASGSQFTANISDAQRTTFNTATPDRWAYKHAHSQNNPEKDWGQDTLKAIRFAFYVLNERFGALDAQGNRTASIKPSNTLVIASSVSNGAGAALAAAEEDTEGLIDGVAVAEPQIQVAFNPALTIKRGASNVTAHSRSLLDVNTLNLLYQPCAALAQPQGPAFALLNPVRAQARCTALKNAGLLTTTTPTDQANESFAKLRAAGIEPDTDVLQVSHYLFAVPAIAVTFANSYSRSSVLDNLCGFSFGATTGAGTPTALANASAVQIFASGNGIPPSGSINLIYNNSVGGPIVDASTTSPSTNMQDYNYDGATCLRGLLNTGNTAAQAVATRNGIAQVLKTGNLQGKPAIIIQGRSDALVPVNHSSRPYLGTNRIAEGANSKLQYYEVTNAQHFDAFIGNALLPGYDTRYIPLHRYLIQSLDLMYAHLKTGAALPPSQVVRTTPRGGAPGAAPAITAANVPPIPAMPASGNAITFSNNTLTIPD